MEESEELVVIELTRDCAPDNPLNGGGFHDRAWVSQTATAEPGEVKLPPTHTFFSCGSQKTEYISPFGELGVRAEKKFEEGLYKAILVVEVSAREVKEPPK